MRTREVESEAKNLIHWQLARERLSSALEYAMAHLEELKTEGYLEDDSGTYVALIDDWTIQASLFIGTVFSLTPSGKYYTPWATSNVESCPRCKGKGKLRVFDTCQACKGNGHRMVSELAALRNESEKTTRRFLLDKYPDCNLAMGHFDCIYCKGEGQIARVCDWCEGLGSREAYLDQVWNETLEEIAGKYDIFVFSGEGDPCDIFLGMAEDCPTD